jgi:DNA topoisomerase-1
VNHGKINATLPKGMDPAALTLEGAVALLSEKASGGGGAGGRLLGEHPSGGPVTARAGRFGAYVNWGKVNATIPKSIAPDEITLAEALDLIAEREGAPAGPRKTGKAKAGKSSAKAQPAKTAAKAKPAAAKSKAGPAAAKPAAKASPAPAVKAKRKA